MRRLSLYSYVLQFAVLTLLTACGNDGYTPAAQQTSKRGELVSAAVKTSHTAQSLQTLVNSYPGLNTYGALMLRDVTTYKLVYWTVDTTGELIKVSGLLAIPADSDSSITKVVSYHHGTIFHTAYAPSNSTSLDNLSAMLASMNFIVALPDYIGYGESVDALHPYMHADSLAKTSVDMLRAAKEFMTGTHVAFSNQLLLGGYSEGGYAALATHKMIQQYHTDEFDILATTAGAGAYDMLETANELLAKTTLPSAAYVAFVFKAYDEIYQFNRISEIFNPLYVETINNDFYGMVDDSIINTKLSNDTATLFNADFISRFRAGNETTINARLTENNIYDWKPQQPVRLYHGQDDITVPYANTLTAQTTMVSNGATHVEITNCVPLSAPANHNNCYLPYLANMTGYFIAQ